MEWNLYKVHESITYGYSGAIVHVDYISRRATFSITGVQSEKKYRAYTSIGGKKEELYNGQK